MRKTILPVLVFTLVITLVWCGLYSLATYLFYSSKIGYYHGSPKYFDIMARRHEWRCGLARYYDWQNDSIVEPDTLLLEPGVTALKEADPNFFHDSLRVAILPDSIVAISASAFRGRFHLGTLHIGSGTEYISEYAFLRCDSICHITVSPANKRYEARGGGLYDRKTGATIAPEPKRQRTLRSRALTFLEWVAVFYHEHTVWSWIFFVPLYLFPVSAFIYSSLPCVVREVEEEKRLKREKAEEERRQREAREQAFAARLRALSAEIGDEPSVTVSWGYLEWEKQAVLYENARKILVGGRVWKTRDCRFYIFENWEAVPGKVTHQSDPARTLLYMTMGFLTHQFYGATAGYYASKWSETDEVAPATSRKHCTCNFTMFASMDDQADIRLDLGYDEKRFEEFRELSRGLDRCEAKDRADSDAAIDQWRKEMRERGISL